jgi:adenosylmethionine-8-amino-7-oxononanoate aminotransferase
MAALEIAAPLMEADPGAPVKLAMAMRSRGVLARPLGRGVAVSPPLTIQSEQLEMIGDVLQESVNELA